MSMIVDGTNGLTFPDSTTQSTAASATTILTTPLAVVGNATAGAQIRLPEDTDNGSNYVALKAPDSLASNLTFTLPSADGTNGQAIVTNGSGTLSFSSVAVGTTTNSATFNNSGTGDASGASFDGSAAKTISYNTLGAAATGATNTFTAAQTFQSANAIRSEAASTQDAIILAGRAGGTSSYAVTFTPTTLSANRTLTLPDASGTILQTGTTVTVGQGGTGATTLTGVLKGNGTSAFTAATAGTDYVAPGTATTFTALQTFQGSTSVAGAKIFDVLEGVTVSATAATGTIAYDVTTQAVLFYTTNASANWTVNFRGSSGTSLNTLMATGESVTVAFLVTQGATPYYNTTVQVDGVTAGVTTRWQGGSAPTSGNASGVDVYAYTIIKTGSAAFSVFASQTQFA